MTIDELISKYYDDLSKTEIHIWNYLCAHKKECRLLSAEGLAKCCNVSSMTIQRFLKKLRLSGYGELKLLLRWEMDEVLPYDEKAVDGTCLNFMKTMDDIRGKDCRHIFRMMDEASHIFVYGTGELQKDAAREMKRVFLYGHVLIHFIECLGTDENEMAVELAKGGDLMFIISMSGTTPGLKEFTTLLKEKDVRVVSMTEARPNELSAAADDRLYITTEHYGIGKSKDMYSSGAAFFLMIELLFFKYMEYQYKKNENPIV